MFDIAPTELVVVALVALLVIGPKDLPKAMRVVGYWVGRARGVARQFRSGFDSMVREAELAEMEKKWAEENERIMREHPPTPAPALPEPQSEAGASPSDASTAPPSDASAAAPSDASAAAHDDVPPAGSEPPVSVERPEVTPAGDDAPAAADGKAAS